MQHPQGSERLNRKMRTLLFAGLLALIGMSIVFAAMQSHDWVAPEEIKNKKNPVSPSDANYAAARSLFNENCAQCHGETGKGDGPEAATHDPLPANLGEAKRMSNFTDGELFYKISVGKKPMPAFKERFSDEQIWQVVLLVRSFSAPAVPAKKDIVQAR